jgi:hypothetical protein
LSIADNYSLAGDSQKDKEAMRVPKYRWLVTIAATVSLTLFNVGCSSTSGYKMPGMGWMSWNGSPSTSSATDPAPPSVMLGANSSSTQGENSGTDPNAQQKYPGTQFAKTGIPAPTNPMGTSTRTDLANTPQDPSLAGIGGPSLGGPSLGGAGNPKAGSPNPQHGFYNTEYQGNGAGGSRNSGLSSTRPAQSPNSAFPAAQDYLSRNQDRINKTITEGANRGSNFANGLNATAQNTFNQVSSQARNGINQFSQPNPNVSTKLGGISSNLRNSAQDFVQSADNLRGQTQKAVNAVGNSWPPNGGTASWAATPAPVTGPPAANPIAGVNSRNIPGMQNNPFVQPNKAPAYTANRAQTNPAFSPVQNSVGVPQTLPTIPASNGYTPGSTGIRGATSQPTTIQRAGFNGGSSVRTPPLNPLPPRTQPANPQSAPRGGSFNPGNTQFAPVGSPYPSTGF